MNADSFTRARQDDWQALTRLLEQSSNGVAQLSPAEVQRLGNLYRAATSDLALAQREFPQARVTAYLNQLVARGHAVIYRGEPVAWRQLKTFVRTGFPCLFRDALPFIVAAALLFTLPALLAGVAMLLDPGRAAWLLPADAQRLVVQIEQGELWTDIPVDERPYASSFIMTNNIQVSFLAFAGGVTGGLLTVYVLLFNGLLLGGITGLTGHYGIGFDLWTFVIGHGVLELSAIFITGGAGLMMGWALLNPGLLRRRDALMLAARKAVLLVLGCIPVLITAGVIEGFLSPNAAVPWPVKWTVGVLSGLLFYGYLWLAARRAGATASSSL
ncbi:MAG: stage II sporulation protein M [Caldilineaceae bacterium]|nr:stage II sporulation protein M [Caldilineaceae bacterium]